MVASSAAPQKYAALGKLPQVDIDLRLVPWPVRDQGKRGTCTAHSMIAIREHQASPERTLKPAVYLSEEYLFWAAKMTIPDPIPHRDGTFLRSAAQALKERGTCNAALWPYSPNVISNNPSHQNYPSGAPTTAADQNAMFYRAQVFMQSPSNAAAVLQALSRCHPVAISVPVFSDPAVPDRDNWTTPLGVKYGVVVDPPTGSINNQGHSVAVTGFAPDLSEPRGGWFIIRNSWGTSWATDAPAHGYHSPEPGYGQISATYLDNYLWEIAFV